MHLRVILYDSGLSKYDRTKFRTPHILKAGCYNRAVLGNAVFAVAGQAEAVGEHVGAVRALATQAARRVPLALLAARSARRAVRLHAVVVVAGGAGADRRVVVALVARAPLAVETSQGAGRALRLARLAGAVRRVVILTGTARLQYLAHALFVEAGALVVADVAPGRAPEAEVSR